MRALVPVDAGAANRRRLLRELGARRGSHVVTYVLSDRQGAQAQVAEDAVRPLYDHLRTVGQCEAVDLFLYSTGGLTDVPWRMVTMIREYAKRFSVIVPYKAMSAATMIAIGADEIVMGPKGELGPIDPQLGIQRGREGETPVQDQVAVEDIMSYLRLIRERVGLSDQAALAAPFAALAQRVDPVILGQINRAHSHIRDVARKLLTSRAEGERLEEQTIASVIEMLAEKTYQHGHAIGRREAEAIGLKIVRPDDETETIVWSLLEAYEELCSTREPLDPLALLGDGDEARADVILGAIESVNMAHRIGGQMTVSRTRSMPSLNLNLQLSLNLPPGLDPASIPAQTGEILQALLGQAQQAIPGLVNEEIRKQAPTSGIVGRVNSQGWSAVEGWSGI